MSDIAKSHVVKSQIVKSKIAKSHIVKTGLLLAALFITVSCGGGSSSSAPPSPPPVQAATPTFWPVAGTYSPTQITLSSTTANSAIYYTTDGSTPSTSSAKYSGPVAISSTSTIKAIATASGFSSSAVASATYTVPSQGTMGATVSIVLTTDDQSRKMEQQAATSLTTGSGRSNVIYVDEMQTYQPIEGFGAAFTDSAAYLLNEVAQKSALTTAMSDLFTRNGNGIGLSFMRTPMGASDLARSQYTYDDNNGNADPTLANFSIAHDQTDIIPIILQAKQLNPQMKLMASPWSPPAWMKTPVSLIGGTLQQPNMYSPFASYIVNYLQAYAAAGVNVDYITLQNEPLNVPADYPGMCMPAAPGISCAGQNSLGDQTTALRDFVLPALSAASLPTKVLVYDHNWDRPDYPQAVLSDPTILASAQVAGTAWHGYGGTPGVTTTIQNYFPTKANYETEHSGGTFVSDQVKSDFEEITQVMRLSLIHI